MDDSASFWGFAWDYYSRPFVQEHLLWLQNHRGVDVVMVLFCLWLGRQKQEGSEQFIGEACDLCSQWSSNVIAPLRASRRWLKSRNSAELYDQTKTLELNAEKTLMAHLAQAWKTALDDSRQDLNGDSCPQACATKNTGLYLKQAGIETQKEITDRLKILIEAI